MDHLPPALAALGQFRQFIAFMLTPSKTRAGKMDKLPCNVRTGKVCNAHDPEAWVDFEHAARVAREWGPNFGVGFVFTKDDPFWFLDIDGAYRDNAWNEIANELCATLAGCAVEISSSGIGLHIFGTGVLPPYYTNKNVPLGLEFYTHSRFVALTGEGTQGDAGFAHPNIAAVVQRYFPPRAHQNTGDDNWWSDEPVPQWRGPVDDDTLIERACRSASAASVFGDKARFVDLWDANSDVLGRVWPPSKDHEAFDASSADAALAQHLAFWTGNNAERILRLMRRSQLVREKWDDRDDYLPRTIRKACFMQNEWLQDAPPAASPFQQNVSAMPVVQQAVRVTERTILMPDEQVPYFEGCVYITDEHKVMVPDGSLLDPGRFNARYGGRSFSMDDANSRSVRKAFEAFTENQSYRFPRADTTCFRPLLEPGEIITEDGRTLANRWRPIDVPRAKGDTARFWHHLEKLLPDERDRNILLGYMAACVQFQGRKFQWAPLIQGTTGNGKNLLSNFVRRAIGRRYCHSAKPSSLGNDFNAWLQDNTFYVVDEIYIEDKRIDLLERLKPLITETEGLEITKKGVDSATKDICGNFWFMTNHRNGMRMNRHDRRIAPFYTAQQQPEDLKRDGLTEDYFRDFVSWLRGEHEYAGQTPGYHVISELLWTYTIPREFDPRLHPRAPVTSSTKSAIEEGMGVVEQEILEAIEMGETCFRGGWVSDKGLSNLMDRLHRNVSRNRRPEIMATLGYIWHPALKDGRPNNTVLPDNVRTRLYVRRDRADLLALTSSAEVAHAYHQAQTSN